MRLLSLPWRSGKERRLESDGEIAKPKPTYDGELSLTIDTVVAVQRVSNALRERLEWPEDYAEGKLLAELLAQSLPWLSLAPEEWPVELPLLRFRSADSQVVNFCGVIVARPPLWDLFLVDVQPVVERMQVSEWGLRLFQKSSEFAEKIRSAENVPREIELWLEYLTLSLKLSQCAFLISLDDEMRELSRYPQNEPDFDLSALPEAENNVVSGSATVFRSVSVSGTTTLWIPFLEDCRPVCWCCCELNGSKSIGDGASITDDMLQQLVAVVAQVVVAHEKRELEAARRAREYSLERILAGGWWEYSQADRTLAMSPNLGKVLGVDDPYILPYGDWMSLVDPRDREAFQVSLSRTVGKRVNCSLRLKTVKGDCWYLFEGAVVEDDVGRDLAIGRVRGFALDIHHVRKREFDAELAQSRLQGLVDSAPGVIYRLRYDDGALALESANARLQEILGWEKQEFFQRGFSNYIHSEDAASYFSHIERILKLGKSSCQYRIRDINETYHWFQDEAVILRNDKGIPTEVVGICLDITALKHAIQQVYRSEEKYRVLVEDSPAIIFRYTPDLKLTFANRSLSGSLGLDGQDLEGEHLGQFLSDKEKKKLLSRIEKLSPDQAVASAELSLGNKAQQCWWTVSERGIFDEQGELLEVHGVGRDDTEIQAARRQLYQSAKLATLGEMAAGLAHEINQPLNVLKMTAANLLDRVECDDLSPEYLLSKLERVASQVQRLSGIVDHMRVFGRQSDWEGVNFNPSKSIHGALLLLEKKIEEKQIRLSVDIEEPTPEVIGHGDRLEQVLINLLINAVYAVSQNIDEGRAGFEPAISVRASVDNGWIKIRVVDNGPGVPPAIADKLFEPFFTTKPEGDGTGLGLSLSYAIVKQMSGQLSMEGCERGAEFVIALPIADGCTSTDIQ